MYTLISQHNSGYLDADEHAMRDGARVQSWSSSGSGKRNQQWHLKEVSNGVFNLINMRNSGYMDVDEHAGRDGAKVQTWSSSGSGTPNQQWILTEHATRIDIWEALRAFAINYPNKLKKHTFVKVDS